MASRHLPLHRRRRPPPRPTPVPSDVNPEEAETADLQLSIDDVHEPIVVVPSGSALLDGIRSGIARHGWTMSDLLLRTDLTAQYLYPMMGWAPGQPMVDVVQWALVLDGLAGLGGRRFVCARDRRSTIGLEQVAHELLDQAGIPWSEAAKRLAPGIPGEPPVTARDLRDAALACSILDLLALTGSVAPVLVALRPTV